MSIRGKAYSQAEIEYIANHYEHDSVEDIASVLGRSESSIISKIYKLKESGKINAGESNYKYYKWSEIEFIRKNYGRLTFREIAIRLGRSRKAIEHTVARLREKEELQNEGA